MKSVTRRKNNLSFYIEEVSVICYTKVAFFTILILYAYFSKQFRNEVKEQIAMIKAEEDINQIRI